MKIFEIRQLDDKDEEISELLVFLGMSRSVARTLTYLQKVDTTPSIDIERGTGLRQPEVSVAMKEMDPYDWISETDVKKPGKGRPNKIYSLKVEFKDIIAHLEKQHKKTYDDTIASIERLKELVQD